MKDEIKVSRAKWYLVTLRPGNKVEIWIGPCKTKTETLSRYTDILNKLPLLERVKFRGSQVLKGYNLIGKKIEKDSRENE